MDTPGNLYAFELKYANGHSDFGLIISTSQETARLDLEARTLAGLSAIIINDQPQVCSIITEQFDGVVIFTAEFTGN